MERQYSANTLVCKKEFESSSQKQKSSRYVFYVSLLGKQ